MCLVLFVLSTSLNLEQLHPRTQCQSRSSPTSISSSTSSTQPKTSEQGYDVYNFSPLAPTLALLGDIGVAKHDKLFVWLEQQLERFEQILYILGNHEFYGGDYVRPSGSP